MTAPQIIEQLYRSPEVDDCISKIVRLDHQDDFKQELFILIYSMPEERIRSLHAIGQIKYYVVRIILNLYRQKKNIFHKKYVDAMVVYDSDKVINMEREDEVNEHREANEARELLLIKKIADMDSELNTPYYRSLVEMLAKHGSQREVSRITGIPLTSIFNAMKKIRNHLSVC